MPSLSKWRRQLKRTPSSNRRAITSGVTTNTQYVADPRGAASATRPAAIFGAVESLRTRSYVDLIFCRF
jgi:hypothetical protein